MTRVELSKNDHTAFEQYKPIGGAIVDILVYKELSNDLLTRCLGMSFNKIMRYPIVGERQIDFRYSFQYSSMHFQRRSQQCNAYYRKFGHDYRAQLLHFLLIGSCRKSREVLPF